jgi:hypothetical protein
MKNVVTMVFVSILLSLAGTLAARAQGYPLVCRSGGSMELSWSQLANGRTNFIAYYSKAPNAAGTSAPLVSGQCAWVDRPLNSAEPTAMLWGLDATLGVRFRANGPTTPYVVTTGGFDEQRAKLFLGYIRTVGNYFTATVYNTNAGYMMVTDFRGGR